MPTLHQRRWIAVLAPVAGALALACSDAPGVDPFSDRSPPTVELERAAAGPDTLLSFIANVRDNLGIKTVSVRVIGGITAVRDTTFNTAVTTTSLRYDLFVPSSVPPGTGVTVVAFASDGAGNVSDPDTLVLATGNLAPAVVRITSPPAGTIAVVGKSLVLSISAKTGLKVRTVGFETSGVLTTADSAVFSSPLADSLAVIDTLTIPGSTNPGQLVITPFVRDSLGRRTLGPALMLTVQTAASTTSSPTVSFGITSRVEVTDTIHVTATDQTGITAMGYEIRRSVAGAVEVADSIVSSGNITSLLHTFILRLPFTTFPTEIFVKAFATNSNGVRAYARLASGLDRVDTVTVVAGMTRPLPQGGEVADALYHPGRDRLYLTNIERNRLEVFELADTSFKAAISTGSRPWGLAPWPRDRNGTMADTLLVANSGGTSISYIRLASEPLFPSGRQFATYALPNIIVYSITSVESSTAPGQIIQQRTRYDFSDRPQYLAATCRGSGPGCGDVILVYSTTPTGGQTVPFPNQGSVRWENLTQETSHFFFEQAMGQSAARADTLVVERFAAGGRGTDQVLLPYRNSLNGGADSVSIVVDLPKLAFRDTTFARNSGNFRRAILGEGGPVLGSRTLMYDAIPGLVQNVRINGEDFAFDNPVIDGGVSRAADVSDFIGNSFARVGGAAINFDGGLAAIRGDSTYLLDPTLRLQGLLPTSGGNPGFDFHPDNSGNPNVTMQACFSFAASTEPAIEVYENRHFQRVSTIPVRDPIIGPIKAAKRAGTGEIVLVGATARGVVVVTLQDTFTGCPG